MDTVTTFLLRFAAAAAAADIPKVLITQMTALKPLLQDYSFKRRNLSWPTPS